jgi:16S rRNA (guanine527-N7)-methyltransferase
MLFLGKIDSLYTNIAHLWNCKGMKFEPRHFCVTGGGFPGIPATISRNSFYLIDVIVKNKSGSRCKLKNVKAEQLREKRKGDFDFIGNVTNMPDFVSWIKTKIKKQQKKVRNIVPKGRRPYRGACFPTGTI